jgi:hypothetical protein
MHNALPGPRWRATGTSCEAGDAKPIPHNQLPRRIMRNGSVENHLVCFVIPSFTQSARMPRSKLRGSLLRIQKEIVSLLSVAGR